MTSASERAGDNACQLGEKEDSEIGSKSVFLLDALWKRAMMLESFVKSYRKKLGSNDSKPWELAMEAAVRKKTIARRPAKVEWDLIDVDLVRGSTFPKEKSSLPWTFFSQDTFRRVVFLPAEREWWTAQSSPLIFQLMRILAFLQLFAVSVWLSAPADESRLSACEALTPVVLMLIVAEILTQAERQEKMSHQLDAVVDDTASVDFDDLDSLSDQSSCAGKRPSRSPVKRRTKWRPSEPIDATLGDFGRMWHDAFQKAEEDNAKEPESDRESVGFMTSAMFGRQLRRNGSFGMRVHDSDETTDSGLPALQRKARYPFPDVTVPRTTSRNRDVLDSSSDVSEVGLRRVATKNHLEDGSTSDKEASDSSENTPTQKQRKNPPATRSVSPSLSDNESYAGHQAYPAVSCQLIGCTLFDQNTLHKTDMTAYEITNSIVRQVEKNLVDFGPARVVLILVPACFALLPLVHTLFCMRNQRLDWRYFDTQDALVALVKANGVVQRYFWGFWFFLLLAVAYETYQQRYLIAKYFGYLTSSRRAKRSGLPHFRLSKVRNVKSWLCIRSCLKKYGPRKSVDVVVSFSGISCLICVIYTCLMVVNAEEHFTTKIYVWEAMLWLLAVGLFLLRFIVLGSKTNRKFRDSSVLTTEQLNLYLKMEQKPQKKEQLMLVNNVLKLAADLIKEIEHPCRISGFPANPFLYNISRLLILSAFSTLISEVFGFKLKLYKLKM